MAVLDSGQGATLIDPYLPGPQQCICERYSVTETRERGGFCTFDMAFTEVGTPGNAAQTDTAGAANAKAQDTSSAAASNVDFPNVVAPPGAAGIGHA
jgi:hypothetical protein